MALDDYIGVSSLFAVGIGPSSSHTVGPMRAAADFARRTFDALAADHPDAAGTDLRLHLHLYGSLAATGRGHGTLEAIEWGIAGYDPETIGEADREAVHASIEQRGCIPLRMSAPETLAQDGSAALSLDVPFERARDVSLHPLTVLPRHPNGLHFVAELAGEVIADRFYFSVGGGFIESGDSADPIGPEPSERAAEPVPFPFETAAELLDWCASEKCSVSDIMLANETALAPLDVVGSRIDHILAVMEQCIERGFHTDGLLPGPLRVERRAKGLRAALLADAGPTPFRADLASEWLVAAAMAVNEENAAGNRVVTAPTNGAAGIIPAVLFYATNFLGVAGAEPDEHGVSPRHRYLLTAAAIGRIYKQRASISGAEMGCQGEIGVAASMAAGALAELLGGTPHQVENAAEIAMEHHLGLTCDPVGGLVQIPCIERNGMGANKAVIAAHMAMRGTGVHKVSLDEVVETMRQTGVDMNSKYKETSRGGLAVNVVEC